MKEILYILLFSSLLLINKRGSCQAITEIGENPITTDTKYSYTKINTSGWKDGVYIVKARVGNEFLSEKLVVKHLAF